MADGNDPNTVPGAEAASNSFSTATKSFQSLAGEVQKMSRDAIDQTTQVMEKLRGAKSIEEVVSIQTTFLQQSFASYADYTRRFSELMMTLPMEFAKQGRTAFQQGAESMMKTTQQAGEQLKNAGDQFGHHQG